MMDRDRDRGDRGDREVITFKRRSRNTEELKKVDHKNRATLEPFMTEHGKIIPGRLTGVGSKYQRKIKRLVKRARAEHIVRAS